MRKGYFAFLGFCFVAVAMLPGCGSIAKSYVEADEATMNAVSPEFRKYVEADASLSEEDKALRYATLDSWSYRIAEAKKAGE